MSHRVTTVCLPITLNLPPPFVVIFIFSFFLPLGKRGTVVSVTSRLGTTHVRL